MTQNYDPQEIAKFTDQAVHWWDTEGEMRTLHQINPLRLNYIQSKVNLSHKAIIDIGCGGGILTESLAKEHAQVTGIDLNKALIKTAKLHQHESGTQVEYLHLSTEEMAEKHAGRFDIVTCFEMLEHVPHPDSIVKACAQLAKPGGHVFFSTLNRSPKSYLFAILGAEYLLKLLPKNTHDYAKFIRPSELSTWAKEASLLPKDMKGITYNPFTKQFKLTDDVSVNYLLYALKS